MRGHRTLWMLTALVIAVTAFIFFNSLQTSAVSNGATDSVLGILAPVLNALESVFGKADWFFLIRKAGHLTEFCMLGIATRCLSYTLASWLKRPFAAHGALYVLAVAVTDEFIQSFSDRTSAVYDVLIDFTGAMIGFAIVAAVREVRRRSRMHQTERLADYEH